MARKSKNNKTIQGAVAADSIKEQVAPSVAAKVVAVNEPQQPKADQQKPKPVANQQKPKPVANQQQSKPSKDVKPAASATPEPSAKTTPQKADKSAAQVQKNNTPKVQEANPSKPSKDSVPAAKPNEAVVPAKTGKRSKDSVPAAKPKEAVVAAAAAPKESATSTDPQEPPMSKTQKKRQKKLRAIAEAAAKTEQPPAKKAKLETAPVNNTTVVKAPQASTAAETAEPAVAKTDIASKSEDAMDVDESDDSNDDTYSHEDASDLGFDETTLDALHMNMGIFEEIQKNRDQEMLLSQLKVDAKFLPMIQNALTERKAITDNIEHFWTTVLMSHDATSQMIEEEDLSLLGELKSVDVTFACAKGDAKSAKGTGYTIKFVFNDNEYLAKNEITVDVKAKGDESFTVTVSPIEWRKGKNFTAPAVPTGGAKTNGNNKRAAVEDSEYDGFFAYFVDPTCEEAASFFDEIVFGCVLNANELYIESEMIDSEDDESDSGMDGSDGDEPSLVDDEAIVSADEMEE